MKIRRKALILKVMDGVVKKVFTAPFANQRKNRGTGSEKTLQL